MRGEPQDTDESWYKYNTSGRRRADTISVDAEWGGVVEAVRVDRDGRAWWHGGGLHVQHNVDLTLDHNGKYCTLAMVNWRFEVKVWIVA